MLDSTTNVHACKDQTMFTTLQKDGDFGYINVGKKLKLKVEGIGRVRLKLHNGKVWNIPNVNYMPTANVDIISLGKMTSHGYKYVGIEKTCKVYKGSRFILQGRKDKKNICYLEGHSMREMPKNSKDEVRKCWDIWELGSRKDLLCSYAKSHIDEFEERGKRLPL